MYALVPTHPTLPFEARQKVGTEARKRDTGIEAKYETHIARGQMKKVSPGQSDKVELFA